jgi:D-glycero-D-manno-heptose 1,7-bisphosphate phosphatase
MNEPAGRAAVFLDKDGTLVRDVPFDVDPDRIRLAPTAAAAVRLLHARGHPLIVITNQGGVALGRFPLSALDAVATRLAELLEGAGARLTGFYACPHHPDGHVAPFAEPCTCRKPQPGLLLRAATEHGLDLRASWMVGDILDDVEAGRRAGCRTALVDNGGETAWRRGPYRTPNLVGPDLLTVARQIAAHVPVQGALAPVQGALAPVQGALAPVQGADKTEAPV